MYKKTSSGIDIMINNILLAGNNKNIIDELRNKLVLLRENDKLDTCQIKDIKQVFEKRLYDIIILCEGNEDNQTLKTIENIKKYNSDTEIILYTDKLEAEFMLDAYDKGIFDFITADSENYEITIKLINCIKFKSLKNCNRMKDILLENGGILSAKNGLFQFKHIKETFDNIVENPQIRHGVLVILKLNDEVKTKVSTNRLNLLVKKIIRLTDIAATGSGKTYLILANTDITGANEVIEKIQNKMGTEFKLHAGISEIGFQDFDTIYKNASDSLNAAITDNELHICLTDKFKNSDSWLSNDVSQIKPSKQFKLFNTAYTNKLKQVIEPVFYRFQKECEAKNSDISITYYTNRIESVFCFKNSSAHSEMVIRYDGYTKLIIEIIHKGLYTCENSEYILPINKLTDKELKKLLKKLKQEFEI